MTEHTKPRRRFRILLGLSLALNLLVVGIVAGAVWRSGGDRDGRWHRAPPSLQNYAEPYVRALPRAERRALHKAIRQSHPQSGRAARREAYAAMLAALRAEPFAPDAVEGILKAQRDRVVSVQSAAQAQWMASVMAMSPAERAAYADRLEERLKRGHKRKQKRQ